MISPAQRRRRSLPLSWFLSPMVPLLVAVIGRMLASRREHGKPSCPLHLPLQRGGRPRSGRVGITTPSRLAARADLPLSGGGEARLPRGNYQTPPAHSRRLIKAIGGNSRKHSARSGNPRSGGGPPRSPPGEECRSGAHRRERRAGGR